jgi:hypothetical protein
MKRVIDERLKQVRKNSGLLRNQQVDINMLIVDRPPVFAVGTSFKLHPPYPQLGDRVVYTNNCSRPR